jgi:hypothetical protein
MPERTLHRHAGYAHEHEHAGPHRHFRHPRRSRPVRRRDSLGHRREHGHSHGLVDDSIKRSRAGLRTVSVSLAILAATAAIQGAIYVATGSVALLADLIHNFGDALTAVPLGIAFLLRSERAERYAGLGVVLAIFVSACVAAAFAIEKLVKPRSISSPSGWRVRSASPATSSRRRCGSERDAASTVRRWWRTATTPAPMAS